MREFEIFFKPDLHGRQSSVDHVVKELCIIVEAEFTRFNQEETEAGFYCRSDFWHFDRVSCGRSDVVCDPLFKFKKLRLKKVIKEVADRYDKNGELYSIGHPRGSVHYKAAKDLLQELRIGVWCLSCLRSFNLYPLE